MHDTADFIEVYPVLLVATHYVTLTHTFMALPVVFSAAPAAETSSLL